MDFKVRNKPAVLSLLESLKVRKTLSYQEEKYFCQLVKGYEGELKFDSVIEESLNYAIILKDLLFKVNGTFFQIDTLAVMRDRIIIYEVKNYEQEYKIVGDDLINCNSNMEIINPLLQVKRSSVLFKQLLNQAKIDIQVDSYVVFVNSNFTLFQPEPHKAILLSSQLENHFKMLNKLSKPLNKEATKNTGKLISCILENTPYYDFPEYTLEQLKVGVTCKVCKSFQVFIRGRMCICQECNYSETAYNNAKRHVQEFTMLFPGEPLNTKVIKEWCNQVHSDYRIRTILKRDYGYMKKDD